MGSEFLRVKGILDKIPATEDETKTISEVLGIKTILVKSGDESVVYESLRKLHHMVVSVKVLEATGIRKSVSALRNHASKDIKQIARMLIQAWRLTVDEWINASDKMQSFRQQEETKGEENNVVQINSEKEDSPKGPVTPEQKVQENNVVTTEVLRIKGVLMKNGDESVVLCYLLNKLKLMGLSVKTLEATGIGKTVAALQKHRSKDVCRIAWKLVKGWKGMVNEYWIAKESSVTTPVETTKRKLQEAKKEVTANLKPKKPSELLKVPKPLRMTTTEEKLEETKRKLQRSTKHEEGEKNTSA